jgi:hypothetical protein
MQRTPAEHRIEDMGRKFEQLFEVLPQDSLPAYLCERICMAILREREKRSLYRERARLFVSSLTGISSLAGLIVALPALMRAADANNFSTIAGLFVSDSDVLASHFSTFMLSLVEAIPGFEVMVTLFLLAVFLVSLQNFIFVLVRGVRVKDAPAPLSTA